MAATVVKVVVVVVVMMMAADAHILPDGNSTGGHRQGFLWVTGDNKLQFPAYSILILTPTLSVSQDLGENVTSATSSTTFSNPFKIDLDELGLTKGSLFDTVHQPREAREEALARSNQAGGQRAALYRVVETWAAVAGVDGHQCLLKLICEVAHNPVNNAGVLGEMLQVFLTPSKAQDKELKEYIKAEQAGHSKDNAACQIYRNTCPYSFS